MAKIFVYDEFSPQDIAMMQALYSRSAQSVEEHVQKVKRAGSGTFMEKFYVGYGHQSIADCGSTTLFIEGISILADKAVQDWPLYAGQETSTRYIDMAKQPIIDPVATSESKDVLDNWLAFYTESQEAVCNHLMQKYPRKENEKEAIYLKAITARCFDILRGFLPAGITTQLSWHTNLRQASDKLSLLRHHPLDEVKQVAQAMLSQLQKKYPNSFSHTLYEDQESYRNDICKSYAYYNPKKCTAEFSYKTTIPLSDFSDYKEIIQRRPIKTGLPHFLAELGTITFDFLLDFGSFRDLQRHRNGVCRMPLLTTQFGFNFWYLYQLPHEIKQQAEDLIKQQVTAINSLQTMLENKQYYVALGFNVPCRVSYGLPAAVYVTELRSGKSVHPTLRKVAHRMYHALKQMFPEIKLHADLNPDDWDVRRGLQDIKEKE